MADVSPVFPEGRHALYEKHRYSAGIVSGGFLFVSGQVGVDTEGNVIEDLEDQFRQAFRNLEAVLKAGGCTVADIVDMTTFHVDMADTMSTAMAVKDEFFPAPPYPTLTGIGVAALFDPRCKLEVKVIARVPTAAG